MAYVKINNTELTNMATHIQKASDALDEVEEIWGNRFAELYADFIDSGFLDSLYEDAESNFYQCLRAATAIGAASSVFLLIPVGGWVAWLVSVLFGVVAYALQGDPQWLTVSKEAFTQLLRSCKEYQDDNYIRLSNIAVMFYHMQLSIEKLRNKVDTFQSEANQIGDTAEQMGLSTRTGGSDDGILLGIETEIVVDGETITVDASEAMSAFYTYAYTVTSTMIAADYLERTYGYEIDYLGLVTKANAFMADTIKSDMYTPEMIQLILPSITPDEQAAYAAASAATGLDESELQAAMGDLAAIGVTPLFAGLVGASFIGKIKPDTGTTGGSTGTGTPCPTCGNDPCTCGTTGASSSTTAPSGNCSKCGNNPCTCRPSGGYTPGPGTTAPTTPTHGIDITPPIETDIPIDSDIEVELGVLTPEGEVDYDKLAMEEYQFETGIEEIEKFRLQIMDEVESMYASGDFTSLTKQLQEFGYGTAEIATILASKSMTVNAFLDGNTRQIIAQKATEMAKADGVEGFKSSYSNNPSTDELADNKKPLRSLHLNSDNEDLCKMEEELDGLEADYRTKVDDANKLLDEAQINKKSVDEIKEKYEKEYGSDTSKWSEDAAKEYDEAIDKYNASAEAANKAIEDVNTAKENYQKSRTEFDKACEDYYKSKIISDEESGQTEGGAPVSPGTSETPTTTPDTTTGNTDYNDGSVLINDDGTVSIGGTSTNNSGDGVSFGQDGSVSLGGTSNNGGTNTSDTSSSFVGASDADFLAALGLKSNDKGNN